MMNLLASGDSGQLLWASTLAVLAAVAFCIVAVAYKLGQSRHILPLHIAMMMSIAGAIFYGAGVLCVPAAMTDLPMIIWIAALGSGISQYLTIRMVATALRLGPLSVMWCAISLSFLPTLPYAYFVFGQGLQVFQHLSVIAAVACVVVATMGNKGTQPLGPARPKVGNRIAYFGLLIALLLGNSVINLAMLDISQRHLETGLTYWAVYAKPYMVLMYASLGAPCFLDLLLQRKLNPGIGNMLMLGLPAAVGSIAGVYLQGCASALGGAVIYAIAGAAGILMTAVIATIFFKEKRTVLWYLTVALGAAAVALGNIRL